MTSIITEAFIEQNRGCRERLERWLERTRKDVRLAEREIEVQQRLLAVLHEDIAALERAIEEEG